jgi:hemoglobin
MPGKPTPYERIGGDQAVETIITAFYQKVIADPELATFFANTDIHRLLAMQREYVTIALGGPGAVSPNGLRDAHAGRGIRGRHFVRFLELFMETIREQGLSEQDIDRVLDRMAIASTDVLDTSTEDG